MRVDGCFSCRGLALFSIAQVFLHPTVSPVLLPKPLCLLGANQHEGLADVGQGLTLTKNPSRSSVGFLILRTFSILH